MKKSRPPEPKSVARAVGDDERQLWRHVTGDVRPLPKTPKPAGVGAPAPDPMPAAAPNAAANAAPNTAPGASPKRPQRQPRAGTSASSPIQAPAPTRAPAPEPGLSPGAAPGLDKRTQMRLKRGQVELEAVIDLHGYTQTEAHQSLGAFLRGSREAGRRTVLVITGKGQGGGGVLKDAVPRWLNEPGLKPMIRAFAHAQPKHGGEGALYVLLKRKR